MSNVLVFTPSNELESKKNIEEFIRFCRDDLTLFLPNFSWDDDHWPQASLFFGNWDVTHYKKGISRPLQQPLLNFAKSYVRYTLSLKKSSKARYEGTVFKCLEKALSDAGFPSDISFINAAVLDRAAELARNRYKASSSYHIGRNLEQLIEFVSKKNLIPNYINWKNPIARISDTIKTGKKAEKIREEKLPNEIALNAIAEVFASNPTIPSDIFTTSVCALLLCVPARVSEVLSLHENCEVHETRRDGSKAYGIRFYPGKGAPPQIKWVPTVMVSLAQESIRRIRAITNEARRIAKWYESNPSEFYRHNDCPKVAEDEYLTIKQRMQALGSVSPDSVSLKNENLVMLQKKVMKRQPKGFPFFDKKRNIKFSEALFCFQAGQLAPSGERYVSKVNVFRPTSDTLITRISISNANAHPNFFSRHGYASSDGSPIGLKSHSLRHLINTMAQKGGMSQVEIARWSGRVQVKQNRVYDHMSEFEIVDMIRSRDNDLALNGPLEELRQKISEKLPVDRQAFNILAVPTAHITEIGYCIHDYAMSPCQKHLDCLNCTEQVCLKGDRRLKNVQQIYEQNKSLLRKLDKDIASGLAGVDRWYEHTKITLQRAENLLSILNDPAVPNGSIIKLHNPQEYSPIKRALEARKSKEQDDEALLDQARLLLGN